MFWHLLRPRLPRTGCCTTKGSAVSRVERELCPVVHDVMRGLIWGNPFLSPPLQHSHSYALWLLFPPTLPQFLQSAGWPQCDRKGIFSCMNHPNGVWDFGPMAEEPLIDGRLGFSPLQGLLLIWLAPLPCARQLLPAIAVSASLKVNHFVSERSERIPIHK